MSTLGRVLAGSAAFLVYLWIDAVRNAREVRARKAARRSLRP